MVMTRIPKSLSSPNPLWPLRHSFWFLEPALTARGSQRHPTSLPKVSWKRCFLPQQLILSSWGSYCWSASVHPTLAVFLTCILSSQKSITYGLLLFPSSVSHADSSLFLLNQLARMEFSLVLWEVFLWCTGFLKPTRMFCHFNIPYWLLNSVFQRQCSFQRVPLPLILQLSSLCCYCIHFPTCYLLC